MKKRLLTVVVASAMALSLVACGGSKGFTGEKTTETKVEKDNIVTVVNFEDGKPVDIDIDIKNEDGTMKSEASKAGTYVMKEGEAKAWHEQVDLLEDFLKENDFDVTKVTLTNDKGNTDAVAGVSIKVGGFLEAVKAGIAAGQE